MSQATRAAAASRRRWVRTAALGALASALAGSLAGSLAGCATPASPGLGEVALPERQWRGRFQLLSPQRQSGRFVLVAKGASESPRYQVELELLTPVGSTAAVLVAAKGRASLQLADGRSFEADSLEELTMSTLGWSVPLAELPGWLEALRSGSGINHPQWRVTSEQSEPLRLLLAGPQSVSLRLLFDALPV